MKRATRLAGLLASCAGAMLLAGSPAIAQPAVPPDTAEVIATTTPDQPSQLSANELAQADQGGGQITPMSASGCTLAPGNFAAMNCIYVNGESDWVNYIRATYDTGGSPYPDNLCNRAYEFQYYRAGYVNPVTIVNNQPGCGPGGFVTYSNTLQVNARLQDGSTVCTRTKNSATDNEWAPYACIYIQK